MLTWFFGETVQAKISYPIACAFFSNSPMMNLCRPWPRKSCLTMMSLTFATLNKGFSERPNHPRFSGVPLPK